MPFVLQTTLARPFEICGIALHTGAPCRVVLSPAAAGMGTVLRRAGCDVAARLGAVTSTQFNTGVGAGDAHVATIEHLMAALSLADIDNVLIEVDGPELPALDGSASPWLAALAGAGSRVLPAPREVLHITAPIEFADGQGRAIRAEPLDGRILEVSIDFPDEAIGAQRVTLDLDDAGDRRRVAQARTFCRRSDVDALRARGLSLGGSLDNALVVDGGSVLNPGGLRDPQEFALHKALDLIGDLRLAGAPIIGRIVATRPGHSINTRFLAAFAAADAPVARRPRLSEPVRARA